MWKAAAGANISVETSSQDDDWETDPDFINDVTEQEQRWGSTTVEGSGRTAGAIDMEKLRRETEEADKVKKKKDLIDGPNPAFGYGGKFGVQKDRMDQSAVGHDYIAKVEKHVSQKDYSTGFGGKFGVQTDRIDKSAVTWDHKEKLEKHASQKDYASGFGGKFGVQTDRQDKSAVGWDHVEKVAKHDSQKDYSVGFGGKFGVQTDRQDKSALGWDHHEAPQKHESQTDHKIGFGGKFGVQTDRMDKSAVTFNDEPTKVGTSYTKVKPDIGSAKPSDLKARFEQMNTQPQNSNQQTTTTAPAPRKNILAKAAIFNNGVKQEENAQHAPSSEHVPKQLDRSKTAFLTQSSQNESTVSGVNAAAEINQLRQQAAVETVKSEEVEKVEEKVEETVRQSYQEEIYENFEQIQSSRQQNVEQEVVAKTQESDYTAEEIQEYQEDEIVDTGLTAIALYDYQAAADDEISFDPEDIITHVETIHEGWWRGMCKGKHGLFPANYVQLQQ